MARKYTKVGQLVEIVKERHNQGETYGEIAASYGLERRQVKSLMERQRRKERMLAAGYIPRSKGRPAENRSAKKKNSTMSWQSCECRWSCCEIFCPKLEGGEIEGSGD